MKKIILMTTAVLLVVFLFVTGANSNFFHGEKTEALEQVIGDLYTSCQEVYEIPDTAVFHSDFKQTKSANIERKSRYYYALDGNQQKLYEQLEQQIDTFPVNSARCSDIYLTREELLETLFSFFYSKPELYWLTSTISYQWDPLSGQIFAVFYGSFDVSEEAVLEAAEGIISEAKRKQSPYQQLKKIQELICEQNEYDYNSQNITYNQTTASALIGGSTVCAGYGRAFSWLANQLGFDTECVVTSKHLFNYVFDEEVPYLVDVCWDDGDDGSINFDFFMIGSETLARIDHTTHHTQFQYDVFPALSEKDYIEPEDPTDDIESTTEAPTEEIEEPTTEPIPEKETTEAPTEEIEEPTTEPIPEKETTEAPTEEIEEPTTEPIPEKETTEVPTEDIEEPVPVFVQGYMYCDGIYTRDLNSIYDIYSESGGFGIINFNTADFGDPQAEYSYAVTSDGDTYFEIPICKVGDHFEAYILVSKGVRFRVVAYNTSTSEIVSFAETELLDAEWLGIEQEDKGIVYSFGYPKVETERKILKNVIDTTPHESIIYRDNMYGFGMKVNPRLGIDEEINREEIISDETLYTFMQEAQQSCFIGHSLYNIGIGLVGNNGIYEYSVSEEVFPYELTIDESEFFLFVHDGRALILERY